MNKQTHSGLWIGVDRNEEHEHLERNNMLDYIKNTERDTEEKRSEKPVRKKCISIILRS